MGCDDQGGILGREEGEVGPPSVPFVPKRFPSARDMARLAGLPRRAEWEAYVSQFQGCAAGASSAEKWQMMEKIFDSEGRGRICIFRFYYLYLPKYLLVSGTPMGRTSLGQ